MSKGNDILSSIGGMYILYKLRWIIFIGIIVLAIIVFSVKGDLDKEYQQYGYTGFSDNIKYDEWTDEVIPKDEIQTYNNDNKWITKSNGEKTTETLEIYELSRSSASIETYSNGGIGFRALDGVFSGWYDNYGNIIYFNTGNLKIIDVKNDKMILGEMDENGFINGKYYAFDISGQFILEAKEIVEYEENYYILTLQNKYIIVDENFNQISNEYDFVYEG